jgi:hypothetical protein
MSIQAAERMSASLKYDNLCGTEAWAKKLGSFYCIDENHKLH